MHTGQTEIHRYNTLRHEHIHWHTRARTNRIANRISFGLFFACCIIECNVVAWQWCTKIQLWLFDRKYILVMFIYVVQNYVIYRSFNFFEGFYKNQFVYFWNRNLSMEFDVSFTVTPPRKSHTAQTPCFVEAFKISVYIQTQAEKYRQKKCNNKRRIQEKITHDFNNTRSIYIFVDKKARGISLSNEIAFICRQFFLVEKLIENKNKKMFFFPFQMAYEKHTRKNK